MSHLRGEAKERLTRQKTVQIHKPDPDGRRLKQACPLLFPEPLIALLNNLFGRIEPSFGVIAAAAEAGRLAPRVGGIDILLPERPGFALDRANVVDAAPPPNGVEQNAVAVGQFDERFAPAVNQANVPILELVSVQVDRPGDFFELFVGDPDVARFPGTAAAAFAALEAEALPKPRRVGGLFFGLSLIEHNWLKVPMYPRPYPRRFLRCFPPIHGPLYNTVRTIQPPGGTLTGK